MHIVKLNALRKLAKRIQANTQVTHAQALDTVARTRGYPGWAALMAVQPDPKKG